MAAEKSTRAPAAQSLFALRTATATLVIPAALPVHAVMLTAAEAEAVEKAIGCLERALERLQEARAGASIYGVHVMWCARTSTECALEALRGAP